MMQRNRPGGGGGMRRMPNPGQGILGSAPGMPAVGNPNLLTGQGMTGQSQGQMGNANLNGLGMGNLGMASNGNFSGGNGGNVAGFGNNSVGFANNKPFLSSAANVGFGISGSNIGNNGTTICNANEGFGNNSALMGNNSRGFSSGGLGNGNMGMGNGMMQRNQQVASGLLGNIPSQMMNNNNLNMNSNTLNTDSMNPLADGLPANQLDSQLSLVNSLLKGNLMSAGMNNVQNTMNTMNMVSANANGGSSGMNSVNNMGMSAMTANNGNNMNLMSQMGMGSVSNQMTALTSPTGGQHAPMFSSNPVMGQQMNNMISQKHQMSMRMNEYCPEAKRMRLDNQGLLGCQPKGPQTLTQGHPSLSVAVRPGFGRDQTSFGRSLYSDYQQHSRRHSRERRDTCSSTGSDRRSGYDGRDGLTSPAHRDYGRNDHVDSGQEEYDPAEPTDEVSSMDVCSLSGSWNSSLPSHQQRHTNQNSHRHSLQERSRSPVSQDRHLTVQQDSRNVSRDLSITIDNKITTDKQDHKRELSLPEPNNKSQYFCHACNVDCLTLKNFENHMESARHKLRIDEVLQLHMQKTSQMNDRLRAEAHLRNIENDDKRNDYCSICDKKFYGHVINHRRSQEHKRKERLTKRGCRLCETGSFTKYPDYVLHIDSQSHKKKKSLLRKDDQHEDDQSQDEDEGVTVDMCEMVTVDATGIFEEEDTEENRTNKPALQSVSQSTISSEGEGHCQDNSDKQEEAESLHGNIGDENVVAVVFDGSCSEIPHSAPACCDLSHINEISEASKAEHQEKENVKLEPARSIKNISSQKTENHVDSKLSKDNDLFDPQVPVGQEYVIPVSGFFCRLCNKFYKEENMAKVKHCQSRLHCEKYQMQKNSQHNHFVLRKMSQTEDSVESQRLTAKDNDESVTSIEATMSNNNDKETGIIKVNTQINGIHDASIGSSHRTCHTDNNHLSDNSIETMTVASKTSHSVLIPSRMNIQDNKVL